MASVLLSPVGNGQQFFDNNGNPNAGGLIYTYQAGSSTLLTTYTTVNGTIANTNPIVLDAYGRTPSEIWMLTGYSYKFVIQTASAVTLQTLDNLYPILQNAPASAPTLPTGAIILWSGSIGSIPSGYVICDGANSTPDLRDRFIFGAGSTYAVGATGGSADSIVVSHTHTATSVVTDPGHNHTLSGRANAGADGNSNEFGDTVAPEIYSNNTSVKTATTGITVATTNASAGTSGTGANLPPYYALAYIMKT
jgi:microcystin-dependent protein